jgi:soluble lytic murein transglycosylase-like protein
MVRAALFFLALTTPAHAQTANWETAGGSLFVGQSITREAPAPAAPPPPNNAFPSTANQPFDAVVRQLAAEHDLDPRLLHAILIVESAYQPNAVSTAGAQGLSQLMPGTARDLGVADPFDPAQNVAGGGAYIAQMLARYEDVRLALAAYNAGPGRVDRAGGVPAIPETQAYVDSVIDCFLALTAGRSPRRLRECQSAKPGRPRITAAAPAEDAARSPLFVARSP